MSSRIDLRLGRWQDVLADVGEVDAVITDPPYSDVTHDGQRHGRRQERCGNRYVSARGLGYSSWSTESVREFISTWAPRCGGWFCCFTDSELAGTYRSEFRKYGLTSFAPIACVQLGMNVRLAGDGPSNWSTYLCVARPRRLAKWGTLPGAYVGNPFDPGQNTATASRRSGVVGSKPLWLMRAIIRDYTRPGDLVVDPCAGGATTLIAAAIEGRRAIGAEMDPETHRKARARIDLGYSAETARSGEQLGLLAGKAT